MATRTIANGGGNWSSNGTWVEGAAPTNADAVVATATSGAVTIDTTTCICASMVLTNYANTMTFTSGQILTVYGNVTFVAAMTISGTGKIIIGNGTTTTAFTTAGKTFSGDLEFAGTGIKTLTGNLVVTGLHSRSAGGVNGAGTTITCNGGYKKTGTAAGGGTTKYILAGGTVSQDTYPGGYTASPIDIAGNPTFSGSFAHANGAFVYVSGTPTMTGSTVMFYATTGFVTTAGMSFNNLVFGSAQSNYAASFTTDITATGLITINGTWTMNGNTLTIFAKGGWTGTGYLTNNANTVKVEIQGGTITGYFPNTQNGCTLKPSVSDITLAPSTTTYTTSVRDATKIIAVASTYNIVTTSNVTYFVSFSGQFDCNTAMEWNCIFNNSGTYTLLSDLYVRYFYMNNATSVVYSGAYNVYVKNYLNYRVTCALSGTATFVIADTCDLFNNTSPYSGSSGLAGDLTIGVNLILNASGKTITFYNGTAGGSDKIYWNNSKTLTYTAGTISSATAIWYTSGAYTFDGPFTIATFINGNITAPGGINVLFSDDFTCTTFRQHPNTITSIATGKILNVTTNMYLNGNETVNTNMVADGAGKGKLKFDGTRANCLAYDIIVTSIDASTSAIPINVWNGTITTSNNVFSRSGNDIGGGGVSVTIS